MPTCQSSSPFTRKSSKRYGLRNRSLSLKVAVLGTEELAPVACTTAASFAYIAGPHVCMCMCVFACTFACALVHWVACFTWLLQLREKNGDEIELREPILTEDPTSERYGTSSHTPQLAVGRQWSVVFCLLAVLLCRPPSLLSLLALICMHACMCVCMYGASPSCLPHPCRRASLLPL